jgi:hypothetical protein
MPSLLGSAVLALLSRVQVKRRLQVRRTLQHHRSRTALAPAAETRPQIQLPPHLASSTQVPPLACLQNHRQHWLFTAWPLPFWTSAVPTLVNIHYYDPCPPVAFRSPALQPCRSSSPFTNQSQERTRHSMGSWHISPVLWIRSQGRLTRHTSAAK